MDRLKTEWQQRRHAKQLAFCICLDAEPLGLVQSRIAGGWLRDYAERTLRLAGAMLAADGRTDRARSTLEAAEAMAYREMVIAETAAVLCRWWQDTPEARYTDRQGWREYRFELWRLAEDEVRGRVADSDLMDVAGSAINRFRRWRVKHG